MNAILAALIRHAITTYGGALVSQGLLSANDVDIVSGAIIALGGVVLSVAEKVLRDKQSNDATAK